jgi:dipeptidase E
MKLFLASRAVHPLSLKKLDEFVGGLSGKSVAYIPTAANGGGYESWKTGGSWTEIQKLGLDITLVQLEDFRNESAVEALKDKDIIWVAGGECGYLMYWMRRCEIDKRIRSLLTDKTVYVGSSAGSMITAPTLQITEWYLNETETGASVIPGLGLVDFDFYPHFEDDQMEYIKAHNQSKKLYAVKDGEVVIVEDNKIFVFGEERVIYGTQ